MILYAILLNMPIHRILGMYCWRTFGRYDDETSYSEPENDDAYPLLKYQKHLRG